MGIFLGIFKGAEISRVGFSIGISLKMKSYPPGNWQKDIEIQSFNFGKTMKSIQMICFPVFHFVLLEGIPLNSAANYRHIPGIEIGNWAVIA